MHGTLQSVQCCKQWNQLVLLWWVLERCNDKHLLSGNIEHANDIVQSSLTANHWQCSSLTEQCQAIFPIHQLCSQLSGRQRPNDLHGSVDGSQWWQRSRTVSRASKYQLRQHIHRYTEHHRNVVKRSEPTLGSGLWWSLVPKLCTHTSQHKLSSSLFQPGHTLDHR